MEKKGVAEMKKILALALLFALMLPVSSVFAYEGGMLHGETMTLLNHPSLVDGTAITTITDGDPITKEYLDNSYNNIEFVSKTFSSPVSVSSYRLNASTAYGSYKLKLTKSDGTISYVTGLSKNNTTTEFPVVSDVVKMSLVFNLTTTNGVYLYDFDVFEAVTFDSLPVTSLLETHNYNSVNLSWDNPVIDTFTGVKILKDGLEVAQLANTTNSYTINGLDPDTPYTFDVVATYSDRVDSVAQTVTVTTSTMPEDTSPPANVGNVSVEKTDTLVSLFYTFPVDTDFSHLEIYRDSVLIQDNFTLDSYDDYSVVGNTTYVYRIVSVDFDGNKSTGFVQTVTTDVSVDGVAPEPPTNIEVVSGNASAMVLWDKSTETDLLGYNIYVDGVKHNNSVILANTYNISGLENGAEYQVFITAVDTSENESLPSIIGTALPMSGLMPIFNPQYKLSDVAQGTSEWFGSLWLILAFSVSIPLTFLIARRIKGLMIS